MIDTGAEVSAISENIFKAIGSPQLHKPEKVLCGPGRQTLDALGCCTVEISHKNLKTIQPVYVIHNLRNNLLGLPAIALTILTKVNAVHRVDNPIAKQFPELFHGLGKTKGEYEIKLKPNARPYSLFLARKVPIPLWDKVHAELQQMEAAG